MADLFVIFGVLCFLIIPRHTKQADLNLRQLQYVSDHLTIEECKRLITALHLLNFQLKTNELLPTETHQPCLINLVNWNKKTSENSNVEDLCLRLRQIDRVDIAQEIAQSVYGETAREIHKYFLDDPFKSAAKRKSILITNDDSEKSTQIALTSADDQTNDVSLNNLFHVAIVILTLTLTVVSACVIKAYFPATLRSICPARCVSTFDAIRESVNETFTELSVFTAEKGFGIAKTGSFRKQSDSNSLDEKNRLVQDIMSI